MLSKTLIQFSVDRWGCISSLLFTWGQTMVEAMKIIVTAFKMSHAHTATVSAPNPEASHRHPMTSPETPGHSQASQGQSLVESLLLSPGSWYIRFCLCPPRGIRSDRQSARNYGQRFITLYRRLRSKPSPRKRNAKRQNGC